MYYLVLRKVVMLSLVQIRLHSKYSKPHLEIRKWADQKKRMNRNLIKL